MSWSVCSVVKLAFPDSLLAHRRAGEHHLAFVKACEWVAHGDM
jgi:hypothetical protein